MIDGNWLAVKRADPRAYGLWSRHYSARKNWRWRATGNTEIAGPGEILTLLTVGCDALFVWLRNTVARFDGQTGVNCTVFRNESPLLSSDLIREADAIADQRWPGARHFTYVEDARVRSSNPGYCFLKAGWRRCGRNADGRLSLLERLP